MLARPPARFGWAATLIGFGTCAVLIATDSTAQVLYNVFAPLGGLGAAVLVSRAAWRWQRPPDQHPPD